MSETQHVLADGTPKTVSYTYDADGQRASVTYPSGTAVTYAYTPRAQVASVTADGPPPMATYAYDLNGNRTTKTLENGTSATSTYDDANRLLSLNNANSTGTLAKFDYTYDDIGNRLSKAAVGAAVPAAQTETYQYDAIDQLTNVAYGTARTTAFNYDATGNRTTVTDSASLIPASYTANNLNQYTAIDAATPAYDANGNLIGNESWTYAYDASNRLLSASNAATSLSFTYDSRNRQASRTIDGVTTFFTWDGWNLIEEHNSADNETRRYIHGAQTDEILALIDTAGTHYYHYDALGSTVALTSAAGAVEEQYSYAAYGQPSIFDTNGQVITVSALGNRFLFTGREWITKANLYDYRNRQYSATMGRFLQTDPVSFGGGDANLYRYVANKPIIVFRDPNRVYSCL